MKITHSQVLAFQPCWSSDRLAEFLPVDDSPRLVTLRKLLALYTNHARWLVARMMTPEQRIEWATACQKRAKKYLGRSRCQSSRERLERVDHYAGVLKDNEGVSYAAERVAAFTEDLAGNRGYEQRRAEHRLAMEHALEILG